MITLALAAVSSLVTVRGAEPIPLASLDPTFGMEGFAITDIGGPGSGGQEPEDEPFWMVAQPDGKYVIAGKAQNPASRNFDFTAIRYNPNGTLDTSFGWFGIVLTDFVGGHDEALSVALQPDGKLVFAGKATRPNGNADIGIVRLNANGSRDTTFGWNGLVMVDYFGANDMALAAAVTPQGKIVVGGFATRSNGNSEFALVQLNSNGARDPEFGWGGIVTTDFFGDSDIIFKLALQSDGKILVSGAAKRSATGSDFALARYNSHGSLDSGFGLGGKVTTDFLGLDDHGFALMIQPDGRILVGGLATNPSNNSQDLALARYNANGSIDTSFATFGAPGLVVTDFFGAYDQALWLLLQPDDKILAVGHAEHPARSFEFAFSRFLPNGDLDTTFAAAGHLTTDVFGGPDGLHAGVLLADKGQVVVAGDTLNPGTRADDFVLSRYLMADPSWISGVVSKLPAAAFATPARRADIIAALTAVQTDITVGDAVAATAKLQDLRTHLDGCGSAPDSDDWILDCGDQLTVRGLVDQVLAKLNP
jgi:uncharacterized delta-60 repeat protein